MGEGGQGRGGGGGRVVEVAGGGKREEFREGGRKNSCRVCIRHTAHSVKSTSGMTGESGHLI